MAAYTPYLPFLADKAEKEKQGEEEPGEEGGEDDNDDAVDELADYEDEDLLRHLGFADDAEVSDADLHDALLRHQNDAAAEGADDLVRFYLLVRRRFFPPEQEDDQDENRRDDRDDEYDDDDEDVRQRKRARYFLREPLVQGQINDVDPQRSGSSNGGAVSSAPLETRVATNVIDVPYQRGTINPLEKKTLNRIIQLDSQTRDPRELVSTNYLFDLGEKLRNVVKVSLYAITIPYHWYTISKAFGADCFYLVPTAPGIAAVDATSTSASMIKVKVLPGNYSVQTLLEALESAIAALPATYPSVRFYGSAVAYHPATGRVTLSLQFQNTFEDPFWVGRLDPGTSPFVFPADPNRLSSLSAYLGFNRPQYNLSCAYSQTLPSPIEDTTNVKLFITADNQTITIVHYTNSVAGSAAASSASSTNGTGGIPYYVAPSSPTATDGSPLLGAPITLVVPVGTYTQADLMMTVNRLMAAEPRLDVAPSFVNDGATLVTRATTPSSSGGGNDVVQQLPLSGTYLGFEKLTDEADNSSTDPRKHALFGRYRFVWSVRLRRSLADPTSPRAKIAVLLPADPVWVNNATGLNFASAQLELQTTRAETPVTASNYIVKQGTYFQFRVHAPNTLIVDPTFTYTSSAVVPRGSAAVGAAVPGYSLAEYMSALNVALSTLPAPPFQSPGVTGGNTAALISSTDGTFQLKVDFALSLGSSNYTFVSAVSGVGGDFFAKVLNITHDKDSPLTDGDNAFDDSTFGYSGTYIVNPNAVLFRIGVSSTGIEAGLFDPDSSSESSSDSVRQSLRDVPFVAGPSGSTSYTLSDLLTQLQISLAQFTDADGARILANSTLAFNLQSGGTNQVAVTFHLNIAKNLTESDLVLDLFDDGDNGDNGADYRESSWFRYLKLEPQGTTTNTFVLAAVAPQVGPYRVLSGASGVESDVLTLLEDTPWSFPAAAAAAEYEYEYENDAALASTAVPPAILVPAGQYTRQQLLATMNGLFAASPELAGSALQIVPDPLLGTEFCLARWSVHRAYGPESYRLLLYNTELFQQCINSSKADYRSANVVPTQTLGWTLGFHTLTSYELDPLYQVAPSASNAAQGALPTYLGTTSTFLFSRDASGRATAELTGDATINVNPYSTLYLTLDDFFKNRTNDSVVTIAGRDTQFSLPSGTSRRLMLCDPATGDPYMAGTSAARMQTLTRNALYANAQLLAAAEEQRAEQQNSTTTNAAFVPTDTLAVLPLKLGSTSFGQTFTENSGSLMVMSRAYRGPITFARGRIQLLTDRGVPLDLNGQNWSVTLLCELLASPATLGNA